jgi:hypothetical protein
MIFPDGQAITASKGVLYTELAMNALKKRKWHV